MLAVLSRHWFLIMLPLVLLTAWLLPGAVPSDVHAPVQYLLVVCIFLASGLAIRSRELGRGLRHWRLHVLVQSCSFGLAVALCWLLDPLLAWLGLSPALRLGLLVLGALPTTITSCVAVTAAAGGNQAGALVNASIGNLLGIFITPLWILVFTGSSRVQLEFGPIIFKLGLLVLTPVLAGQMLQSRLLPWLTPARRKGLGTSTLVFLLGIIFLAFSQAFASGVVIPALAIPATIGICCVLHALLLIIPWQLSRWRGLRLTTQDRICALICSSQKTMAFGLPVIALVFAGSSDLVLISLPILVYHPLQLFVAGALVPRLRRMAEIAPESY